MKPCSICGGDHKAGARGEGHAKAMRKQKAAAAEAHAESACAESSSSSGSSASSTPSSPRGAGDQGGIPKIPSEVLQGERSREPPDPEPAPAPKAARPHKTLAALRRAASRLSPSLLPSLHLFPLASGFRWFEAIGEVLRRVRSVCEVVLL